MDEGKHPFLQTALDRGPLQAERGLVALIYQWQLASVIAAYSLIDVIED
jgi:hypothetical protein